MIIDYAALETTVKYGKKLKGDIHEKGTRDKYTKYLISSLKDDAWQNALRPEMMDWANKTYGWEMVAMEWSDDFKEKK